MSLVRDVSLAANTVTAVDVTGANGVLDIYVPSGLPVWARIDGGTPAVFGGNSFTNWFCDPLDEQSTRHIYIDTPPTKTLRLLAQSAVPLRITQLHPLRSITRLNRGYGLSGSVEYPLVGAGVTNIVLTGSYRPGEFVRVDFQQDSSDFAVTSDGTTPDLTAVASTPLGGYSHMVQLAQVQPEQSLKVYATAGSTFPQNIRVQRVLASAIPA